MTDKFINSKSCRNRKLCINVQHKYRENVVLEAIFCFSHLKVNDTKDKMLSDTFDFSTPRLCKNKREKICSQMASKVQCFIFQPRLNTHIFKKGGNILSFKNIYAMYKSKYLSNTFQAYTHLSSENIG